MKASLTFIHGFCSTSFSHEFTPCVTMLDGVLFISVGPLGQPPWAAAPAFLCHCPRTRTWKLSPTLCISHGFSTPVGSSPSPSHLQLLQEWQLHPGHHGQGSKLLRALRIVKACPVLGHFHVLKPCETSRRCWTTGVCQWALQPGSWETVAPQLSRHFGKIRL